MDTQWQRLCQNLRVFPVSVDESHSFGVRRPPKRQPAVGSERETRGVISQVSRNNASQVCVLRSL